MNFTTSARCANPSEALGFGGWHSSFFFFFFFRLAVFGGWFCATAGRSAVRMFRADDCSARAAHQIKIARIRGIAAIEIGTL
jgi:hypothetical protein